MRTAITAALVLSGLALAPSAQTTGVVAFNRMEVFDHPSGTWQYPAPCTAYSSSVTSPGLGLRVCSANPNQQLLVWVATSAMGADPSCAPCTLPLLPTICANPPYTTCGGTTNHSIDLPNLNIAVGPLVTGAQGMAGACRAFTVLNYSTLPAPEQLIGQKVSIQAVLLADPCSVDIGGALMTNAFEVVFAP